MNNHYDEQYYVKVLDRYIACGESPTVEDPCGWMVVELLGFADGKCDNQSNGID